MSTEPVLWYYVQGTERRGPITDDGLARLVATGEVTPDTLLWNLSLPGWVAARTIFTSPPPSVQRHAARSVPAATQQLPAAPAPTSAPVPQDATSSALKVLGGCLFLVVIIVGAIALGLKGAQDEEHVSRFMTENPGLTRKDLRDIINMSILAAGRYGSEGFNKEKILDTFYAFNVQKIPISEWDDLLRLTTILAYSTQEDLVVVGDSLARLDIVLDHSHAALDHFVGAIQELQKTCPGPAKDIREFQTSKIPSAIAAGTNGPLATVNYSIGLTSIHCSLLQAGINSGDPP